MSHVELKRGRTGWLVRLRQAEGTVLEYRYASQNQARFMAAVFDMGPTHLPPPHAVRRPKSPRKFCT
jgi:hypothetical protein